MRFLLNILFFLSYFISSAQINRCSTDEYRNNLKDRGLYNYHKQEIVYNKLLNVNYTIPVVVHVLYNNNNQNISDERIFSQIQTLNEDYNMSNLDLINVPLEFQSNIGNVGFSFCLVQQDLQGNPFTGINRVYTEVDIFQGFTDDMKFSSQGGVDAWDPLNYLNIWVCDLSGNTLGFATMPGDVDPELDGVVIDYEYFGVDLSSDSPYNLGRTGTHEIGHYFNLEHTFYAGCSDWDGCDDTPSLSSPTYGCPAFPQESCQSINMTMNYMDYTNDACMHMFTICQAEIMVNALSTYRSDLISDNDCSIKLIDYVEDKSVNLYPNPFSDILTIDIQNENILMYDIYGRNVLNQYIENDNNLNLSYLPSGNYFIFIKNKIYKIIKN
ncbi:MAG: zinc metalloprotease [Flavobacteriales bacterium]|nr:zinc metalloprotease [Flavobacteriales bacterium]|tara:strand:+ start:3168 stop:4316 length:1149 start_codon:yes stop_codon:yes gene_type:complete